MLDQYCAGCHGGTGGPTNVAPNLYATNRVDPDIIFSTTGNTFPQSYVNLHRYVRRTGNEGYLRLNNPGEWHADTSELIQILQKGHYGVTLDTNAWDRLVTWIDLNVPAYGIWSEHTTIAGRPITTTAGCRLMASLRQHHQRSRSLSDPGARPAAALPHPRRRPPSLPSLRRPTPCSTWPQPRHAATPAPTHDARRVDPQPRQWRHPRARPRPRRGRVDGVRPAVTGTRRRKRW